MKWKKVDPAKTSPRTKLYREMNSRRHELIRRDVDSEDLTPDKKEELEFL